MALAPTIRACWATRSGWSWTLTTRTFCSSTTAPSAATPTGPTGRARQAEGLCNICFGEDEDGDPLPKPPFVLIVAAAPDIPACSRHTRDVAAGRVPAGLGGAANVIYQYCVRHDRRDVLRGSGGGGDDDGGGGSHASLLRRSASWRAGDGRKLREAALLLLHRDARARIQRPAKCILAAVLSDCEKTVDAINPLSAGETAIIQAQLEESQSVDAGGIAKAFQSALLGKDEHVVATLVEYSAKAERVSFESSATCSAAAGAAVAAARSASSQKLHLGWAGVEQRLRRRLRGWLRSMVSGRLSTSGGGSGGGILTLRSGSSRGGGTAANALPSFVRVWQSFHEDDAPPLDRRKLLSSSCASAAASRSGGG